MWGLYRGVLSPLLGIGLCNAVLFSANSVFRESLTNEPGAPLSIRTAPARAVCGCDCLCVCV